MRMSLLSLYLLTPLLSIFRSCDLRDKIIDILLTTKVERIYFFLVFSYFTVVLFTNLHLLFFFKYKHHHYQAQVMSGTINTIYDDASSSIDIGNGEEPSNEDSCE